MAQGTQRPASLPSEPTDGATRTAADPSSRYTGRLPDTTARRMRLGGAWRDSAGVERDRASLSTEEVADGLARARQLYRHPRMQRLARRSA